MEGIKPKDVVDYLNELLALDRELVTKLVKQQTVCNEGVAQHPSVKVRKYNAGQYSIGLVGLLNGLFSAKWGPIYVKMEEESVVEFGLTEDLVDVQI